MRKFNRAAEPNVCVIHSPRWNAQWVEQRKNNPNARFNWYQVEGKSARDHILPVLREQNQRHCSFCDAFPVDGVSIETIEHFRPKSAFPAMAFSWENLYYCCDACQTAKREQWDEQLLNPDASDYRFERYFEYDFTTGEIKPNSLAPELERTRASVTIKLYNLDSPARRRNRLDEADLFNKSRRDEIPGERWAYRDFLNLA